MELNGKHVLVVGLGETGLAMAAWLVRQGARVCVADSRAQPPNVDALRRVAPAAELLAGPFADAAFSNIDLIAISPGVPVQTAQVQAAQARGVPVVSEIELFAWGVRRLSPSARIVAITGSNGKTTTTALTGALCAAAGLRTGVAGNISPAALAALMAAEDADALPEAWVLELSSFQLETTHTLNADAATVLNVSEDHLDRYAGMDDYAAAKARIFKGAGVMVLNRDDARSLAAGRCGRKLATFGLDAAPRAADYGLVDGWIVRGTEKLIALADLKLVGAHNAANAMAALALCEAVGIAPRTVLPALAAFRGLAHRVEFVAALGGVDYYDDSKGTNVGATLAALQGMGRKVAIILGGDGKGQDFSPLKAALAAHGRAAALIGRDAGAIAAALEGSGVPLQRCADMDEAVRWCAGQAQVGDAVLLSPACASLDMYRNYAHRAEVFVAAVRGLEGEGA
ncbi:MAG: UDP-N-acetylmuramoylalanine--D-glutamate ligase [Candidatus Accumulibacter sp. 66-26]|nr:UDP-N-acetylmuramoyl-L-alanine--D-glutamate ligase [Accumulibacter sp.]OJW51723.1 MAG: UDP-N-acetylmuramoylalanine--D-glutamate ligase [Candidatus Accumulibacter sp. 66-26]